MDRPAFKLEARTVTGKNVKKLRRQGIAPASICGKGVENQNVQVNARDFDLLYRHVGRTTLVDLQMPQGATQSAFVRQVQRNPVTGQLIHVDFRVVDLLVEMAADVPVVLTGENTLVEQDQAVAVLSTTTLHVRGLPTDLPQAIEVDISSLEDFHSSIHVRDITVPAGIEVLTSEDEVVASLTPSRTQEDEEQITEEEQMGEAPADVPNAADVDTTEQ